MCLRRVNNERFKRTLYVPFFSDVRNRKNLLLSVTGYRETTAVSYGRIKSRLLFWRKLRLRVSKILYVGVEAETVAKLDSASYIDVGHARSINLPRLVIRATGGRPKLEASNADTD